MSLSLKNILLIAAVVSLAIFPLMIIHPSVPGDGGEGVEIFSGADSQAEGVIQELAPDYRPWFSSLMEPPSAEIESLLFALQAAIGAGFIGYYLGFCRGRLTPAGKTRGVSHVA